MSDKEFGEIALKLLAAAQIPGNALDQAVLFREMARALASGALVTSANNSSAGGV